MVPGLYPHTSSDFDRLRSEREELPRIITEAKAAHEAHGEAEVYQQDVEKRLQVTEDMLEEFPSMNFMGDSMLLAPSEKIHPGQELGGKLAEATGMPVPPYHDMDEDMAGTTEAKIAPSNNDLGDWVHRQIEEYDSSAKHTDGGEGELLDVEATLPTHEWGEVYARNTQSARSQDKREKSKAKEPKQTQESEKSSEELEKPKPEPRLHLGTHDTDTTEPPVETPAKDTQPLKPRLGESYDAFQQRLEHARQDEDQSTGSEAPQEPVKPVVEQKAVVEQQPDPDKTQEFVVFPDRQDAEVAPEPPTSHDDSHDYATRPFYAEAEPGEVTVSPSIRIYDHAQKAEVMRDHMGMVGVFLSDSEWRGPDFSSVQEKIDNQREQLQQFSRDVLANPAQPELTREIISTKGMEPILSIVAGDREFRLSQVFRAANYDMAVGYTVLDGGSVAPRIFYRSNSSGEWRAPNFRDKQHFGKGKSPQAYANETKLSSKISDHLDALVDTGHITEDAVLYRKSQEWFRPERLKKEGLDTYSREVQILSPNRRLKEQLFAFVPGYRFLSNGGIPAAQYFEGLNTELDQPILEAFEGGPRRIDYEYHTLLGDTLRESYRITMPENWVDNEGRRKATRRQQQQDYLALRELDVEYNYSRNGDIWIGNVRFARSPVSSYGNDAMVFEGGLLLNKPIEYKKQVDGLVEGVDYKPMPAMSEAYVSITPLLDRLPLIRRFRALRNIRRR